MAELLPLVDIGNMDLDARYIHRLEGIQNGIAVMGKRAGIHNDGVIIAHSAVDGINQCPLMVGLDAIGLSAHGRRFVFQHSTEGLIAGGTVDARFPAAQQIQIGTIENEKFHRTPSNVYNCRKISVTVSSTEGKVSMTASAAAR